MKTELNKRRMKILGMNIQRMRESRNLTRNAVGIKMGWKRSAASRMRQYEEADNLVSVLDLLDIADILDYPINDLLSGCRKKDVMEE